MKPYFRQVEWVILIIPGFLHSHHLDFYVPFWILFPLNGFHQITLGKVRIFSLHLNRFVVAEIFYSLGGFEMKLYPNAFIGRIDHTKCVTSESMHMPVAVWRTPV